jgi:hypothetical protein
VSPESEREILARVTTVLEFLRDGHADHEARLRVQEAKPTISPRALWTFAIGAVGALGAVIPLVTHSY